MKKTAFIAIVGKPNVGKSSILNKILKQKIAIVSSKPQTTRTRIMGVLTENDTQLVFIDTPGLHKPRNSLDKFMLRSVNESVEGVDACLLVTEAGASLTEAEKMFAEKFKALGIPAVLAINKTDTVRDKTVLAPQIAQLSELYDFSAVVPCSAENGSGLEVYPRNFRTCLVRAGRRALVRLSGRAAQVRPVPVGRAGCAQLPAVGVRIRGRLPEREALRRPIHSGKTWRHSVLRRMIAWGREKRGT